MQAYALKTRNAIPLGYAEYPCAGCGCVVLVDDHAPEPVMCGSCKRAMLDGEMHRIMGDVKDITMGRGTFEFASPVERQRFLRRLRELVLKNIMPLPVNACCEETTAEPVYVWDGEAPDPATRKELEDRLEALAEEEALAAIEA